MSHRTILEFNHDYLHDLKADPKHLENLLRRLMANDWQGRWTPDVPGVRKVGERHHSETLKLTID
jgi:hypothetical protein